MSEVRAHLEYPMTRLAWTHDFPGLAMVLMQHAVGFPALLYLFGVVLSLPSHFLSRWGPWVEWGLYTVNVAVWAFLSGSYARAVWNATVQPEQPLPVYQVPWIRLTIVGSGIVIVALTVIFAFVWPAIYVYVCTSLVTPLMVIEGMTMRASLQESFNMTKGRFWKVFKYLAPLGLFVSIVIIAVQIVASLQFDEVAKLGPSNTMYLFWLISSIVSTFILFFVCQIAVGLAVRLYIFLKHGQSAAPGDSLVYVQE